MTAPPGLSQPPTSFIGPWYQGIHRPPLPTYPQLHIPKTNHRTPKDTRVHYANLNPPPTHNHTNSHRRRHSHAWHQDNNPPVVLSEPQQGAHRPHRPTERRVPATPPHSRVSCTCGAGSAGPNSPVSPPTEQPRPDIGGPQGLSGPGKPLPGQVLLRKEVIQPHLPVRLPCYDFVPIASPTFDGSPPRGLGHRLRVLPTFVT